jgi:DNA invertase Pin-like site-specific DNA recombinase
MGKIHDYCAKNGITVIASFADEAKSGTSTEERTEFLKLLAAAERREFEVVIIYDVTRGSRDIENWFGFRKIMQQLKQNRVLFLAAIHRLAMMSSTKNMKSTSKNPLRFVLFLICTQAAQAMTQSYNVLKKLREKTASR